MAVQEMTGFVQTSRYSDEDIHLQNELPAYGLYSFKPNPVFQKITHLRSCVNTSKSLLPNSSYVFKYPNVPILPIQLNCWGQLRILIALLEAVLFICVQLASQTVIKMQRFGFYMSNGSLIGLQDIYRYYNTDPIEDADYPHYANDNNDKEWQKEAGVGEDRKVYIPNGWIPHPEVEKLSWMSEPDLFSSHPSTNPNAVLESKESYHSLASLVNWQRLLSDMRAVSLPIFPYTVDSFLPTTFDFGLR